MQNCGTCKYWKRDIHSDFRVRECQRMLCDVRYGEIKHGRMILQPEDWRSGLPDGYHNGHIFSVDENFGCILWEKVEGPFYVDARTVTVRDDDGGTRAADIWDIRHSGSSFAFGYSHDEKKTRGICEDLNKLWQKDKCDSRKEI